MILDEFLTLCGFSAKDKEEHYSRVEKAFQKVGINDADIQRGIARINRYFDVELQGVRKLLSVHLLAFLELVLAKEEGKQKIIYGEWPLTTPIMMAIRRADPANLVATPAMVCNVVMGQIFSKLVPITEAGEEMGQTGGQAHCPLYQTHVGSILKGIAPMPDLEIASGFLCEPPGAALQLLEELYGVPVLYVDGCVDGTWGEWPKPYLRQVEYGGQEIARCMEGVEKLIGVPISDEAKTQAFKECGQTTYYFQNLLTLIARSDPQPLSQVDAGLALWIINTPLPPELMKRAIDAFATLYFETEDRVKQGFGIMPKGSPRVYVSIAVAADPAIMKLFEESGLAVPCAFMTWQPPAARFKLPYDRFSDRVAGFGQKMGIVCSTCGAIEQVLISQRELQMDGAIMCFATSCRLYSMSPIMTKKALQKEFGDMPVIVLEGEFYDARNYGVEQMRTRVETFAQVLRERKGIAV